MTRLGGPSSASPTGDNIHYILKTKGTASSEAVFFCTYDDFLLPFQCGGKEIDFISIADFQFTFLL